MKRSLSRAVDSRKFLTPFAKVLLFSRKIVRNHRKSEVSIFKTCAADIENRFQNNGIIWLGFPLPMLKGDFRFPWHCIKTFSEVAILNFNSLEWRYDLFCCMPTMLHYYILTTPYKSDIVLFRDSHSGVLFRHQGRSQGRHNHGNIILVVPKRIRAN